MKTFKNLFPQVFSFENIHLGFLKARKGKKKKKDVVSYNYYAEYNLTGTRQDLMRQNYKHGGYHKFIVQDSKKRLISAPCFRDRVMHHALCNVIEPIFEKTFIPDSYACRINRGTHKAVKKLKSFLKRCNLYCLTCDISKYFDSISHDTLLALIKDKIKDEKVLWLIKEIVKSSSGKEEGIGIPIGNLTSQLFANIYLNALDRFVKDILKEPFYVRYMDDFLLLKDKSSLHAAAEKVNEFLYNNLDLKLNLKKVNIFPLKKGIDFLGYVVFKDYSLLRKSTVKRFLKKAKKGINENIVVSWNAYADYANAYLLRKNLKLL